MATWNFGVFEIAILRERDIAGGTVIQLTPDRQYGGSYTFHLEPFAIYNKSLKHLMSGVCRVAREPKVGDKPTNVSVPTLRGQTPSV